ncbi:type II toxin-antitoxin system RelB/DinJ family antitoxin [bacterium]|nr:type II toxin-antitoxin system RelB/DinJ family antitoxin [bacterium]
MNNKASITIRTDIQAKNDAQRILSSLGLDMSTAINIFLRQVIQEEGLPFKVVLKHPNATTLKTLAETQNNKNLKGPFDSVEELMNDLDA